MTVQEAIAQIEPIARSSRKVSGVGLFEPKPITVALEMAISVLGKQIPKKPKVLETDALSGYKYGNCSCGEHIMDDEKYCSNCGQAIDWGEE